MSDTELESPTGEKTTTTKKNMLIQQIKHHIFQQDLNYLEQQLSISPSAWMSWQIYMCECYGTNYLLLCHLLKDAVSVEELAVEYHHA